MKEELPVESLAPAHEQPHMPEASTCSSGAFVEPCLGVFKAPVKFDSETPVSRASGMEWEPSDNTQILSTVRR